MKNLQKLTKFILLMTIVFFGCSSEENIQLLEVKEVSNEVASNEVAARSELKSIGSGVMMQAFYWDVPAGGTWWDTVKSKVKDWSNAGIDAIWLPPATKGQGGPYTMGYDLFDYFDFGEYDQMGSVETRFGSKTELKSLINEAHNNKLSVIADIVINHNSGGDLESNPFSGKKVYTDFNPLSGKFFRSSSDFHPNNVRHNDTGVFEAYADTDLSHHQSYVQDWLWRKEESVAKYYKNVMGFDGWRFDFVKGFETWVVRDWKNAVGGFAIGEYWDGNVDKLNNWANGANSSVFDFPAYYKMRDAFDGNNMYKLTEDMMLKRNPQKAVTFVTNHDTNEIFAGKMRAYAYILTHEGYPTIFYRDYEEWLDKNKLNNLIWIHNNLAGGSTNILFTDNDEYIAKRNGYNNDGLVVYINNADHWQERWIKTNWSSKKIKDYTGNSSWEPVTQSGLWVKIQVPPKSYSVWAPK
ncbi:MAG: alpha-amylase [Ekhidna sp.]|nr:alpha-amylase [Ekhidna sp.]